MNKFGKTLLGAVLVLSMANPAMAADIDIDADIAASTTWTANNVYHLRDVIYVLPGATLTIEPGTVIKGYTAAELAEPDSSALVITKGAQIFANGTEADPIIFTADEDDFATYQAGMTAEWGNLTILGDAFIADGTNCASVQNGTCFDNMEGLVVSLNSRYGGTDDDDSSGRVQFVSLRYGGAVIGAANELNGMSLGGVGRETDINHVDIINNIDDGIEIWGGTVGLKYISAWNNGDDSFDLDEGYRGKAQFVLLVQGYANLTGPQESGFGDNVFEMDGGETTTTMQPYADPQIYNVTAIGQNPAGTTGGDFGLTFRDNMRAQIGNSIFLDIGDDILSLANGNVAEMTAAFTTDEHDTFTATGYGTFPIGPHATIADFYNGASDSRSGKWSWVKNSIFKNYHEHGPAVASVGLFNVANANLDNPAASPIVSITRDLTAGQPIDMQIVTNLDPRAAGDAVTSGGAAAPADGFFAPVQFIGAFSKDNNWLCGWTAAAEWGLTTACSNPADPSATIQLAAATSFASAAGVWYTVEQSPDGNSWSPIGSVLGNGGTMNIADLAAYDPAKLFRVVAQ